jgi:hypothetical protein
LPKALALFREALDVRLKIYRLALNEKGDEGPKFVSNTRKQLNIASNDVIHSLNMSSNCDEALSFIGYATENFAELENDQRAITLHNVAAAHVCARQGDSGIGLLAARWAAALIRRMAESKNSKDMTRLAGAYFTLWAAAERAGDDPTCITGLKNFAAIIGRENREHVSENLGTVVAGEVRTVERCLQLAQGASTK